MQYAVQTVLDYKRHTAQFILPSRRCLRVRTKYFCHSAYLSFVSSQNLALRIKDVRRVQNAVPV